jgi:hypothetical protein
MKMAFLGFNFGWFAMAEEYDVHVGGAEAEELETDDFVHI